MFQKYSGTTLKAYKKGFLNNYNFTYKEENHADHFPCFL